MVDVTINNSFERAITDRGYKWFEDNWRKSLRGFQKRFDDEVGTKYYITGYHYNLRVQLPEHSNVPDRDTYTLTAQFRVDSVVVDIVYSDDFLIKLDNNTNDSFEKKINSELPDEIGDIDRAERFFEKLWSDFKFEYYKKRDY